MEKLIWCFSLKNGLRLTEPDEDEALAYERAAEETFKKLDKEEGIWKVVKAYYTCYFALYSILRTVGLKSENHFCTFQALRYIFKILNLDMHVISYCEKLKEKRILAQYYLKDVPINISTIERTLKEAHRIRKILKLKKNKIRGEFEYLLKLLSEKEI